MPYGWESMGFRSEDRAYPFAIRDTIEISNDIVLSASSGVFGQTVMKYSVVYMLAGLVDYIVFAGNSPFQVNEWLVREVIQKAMCVLRHKMPAPLRRFDFDGMCRCCIEDNMMKLTIRHGGKTYHIFSDYLLSPCLRLKAAQRW